MKGKRERGKKEKLVYLKASGYNSSFILFIIVVEFLNHIKTSYCSINNLTRVITTFVNIYI